MNKNWGRWCLISIHKHFEANKDTLNMYVEGHEYLDILQGDRIELRVDGPEGWEISKDYWRLDFEVNFAVTCAKGKDKHKIHRDCGIVAAAFKDIPVFKYGSGPDDDDSYLGCLLLRQEEDQKVTITHLGQIDPKVAINQATIEGHYRIHLQG